MSDARIDGLVEAVRVSPDNDALRLVLAEALLKSDRTDESLEHFGLLLERGALPKETVVTVGRAALDSGNLQLAARALERAKELGIVDGVGGIQDRLERELGSGGTRAAYRDPEPEEQFSPEQFLEQEQRVTFDDVGGLDDVKKSIHRSIILPFQRPDLYLKYGRRAGGGVMLYGPPGCGKTLLARATAGECSLPFYNLRIEDVLDPFIGQSERNLHEAFEQARASAPCVLFIDELDALAYARRKQAGGAARPLVDQLLQELDAIGSDNRGLLILSATNAPWDVDDALKRPGRLDRPTFVPPPDVKARQRILGLTLTERHMEDVDTKGLAKRTPLFSGADLRALTEAAVDRVIDEALDSGEEPPLQMAHFDGALPGLRPTTADWLASARNYVDFANQAGRYDEVATYLKSREGKKARELAEEP